MNFKQSIIDYLTKVLDLDPGFLDELIEIPPQKELGDFAIPCYKFAKSMHKSPAVIAGEFAAQINQADSAAKPAIIQSITASGPYLNVFLDRNRFNEAVINSVLAEDGCFLQNDDFKDQTVCFDFSSPNVAKPFHVGHAFSTIIGDVLARMYEHAGADTVRINHLGDYGTQFGSLIVAYEKWGDEKAFEADPIKELLRIYVKFHDEVKTQPELKDEARLKFRNLEAGEEYELNLWKIFRAYSLRDFQTVYDRLDVKFDSYKGEAFYVDMLDDVVDLLNSKGLLEQSEGALVVNLEQEGLGDVIVRKSDGSSIYTTRDLAAAIYRYNTYKFDKLIYVVGSTQALHFAQLFKILEKAGFDWAENMYFVGFGLVKFPEGVKLSTRSGDVVYLEDLLNESVKKTKEIIINNNEAREDKMTPTEIDTTAEIIGLAAVKYTFLRNSRERDIIFDWNEILDFEGDTACYMLYAYARAKSILRKADNLDYDLDQAIAGAHLNCLDSEAEYDLCNNINALNLALTNALKNNEPSIFARQIMETCRSFSKFYNQESILQAEAENVKAARLALTSAFAQAIKESLNLLGISTVERM